MKLSLFLVSIALFLTQPTLASDLTGFIEIRPGRSLYVDWTQSDTTKPTVILLNGLTYSTTNWDAYTQFLVKKGFGVLRYDPFGMGKTLARSGNVQSVILIEEQARDLDLLTTKLGLTGKLNLVGLSYGGGLAIAFAQDFSERVGSVILMCPFTEPLAQQDSMIKQQIAATRLQFPSNPATDEDLYAYFLRQNIYYVYPYYEPSMLESPLKPEAVFQMVQGIRTYDALAAASSFPAHSVHMVLAEKDQYIPRATLEKYWNTIPASQRASKMLVDFSEHKIPEAFPSFAAEWTSVILSHQPGLDQGQSFEGNPITGKVTSAK